MAAVSSGRRLTLCQTVYLDPSKISSSSKQSSDFAFSMLIIIEDYFSLLRLQQSEEKKLLLAVSKSRVKLLGCFTKEQLMLSSFSNSRRVLNMSHPPADAYGVRPQNCDLLLFLNQV